MDASSHRLSRSNEQQGPEFQWREIWEVRSAEGLQCHPRTGDQIQQGTVMKDESLGFETGRVALCPNSFIKKKKVPTFINTL